MSTNDDFHQVCAKSITCETQPYNINDPLASGGCQTPGTSMTFASNSHIALDAYTALGGFIQLHSTYNADYIEEHTNEFTVYVTTRVEDKQSFGYSDVHPSIHQQLVQAQSRLTSCSRLEIVYDNTAKFYAYTLCLKYDLSIFERCDQIYLPEIDLLVVKRGLTRSHPRYRANLITQFAFGNEDMLAEKESAYAHGLLLVDNAEPGITYYYLRDGKVFRVKSITSMTRPDGIHEVFTNQVIKGGSEEAGKDILTINHYTLEDSLSEKPSLGAPRFFTSIADAENYFRNSKATTDSRIGELEYQLAEKDKVIAEQNAQFTRVKSDKESKLKDESLDREIKLIDKKMSADVVSANIKTTESVGKTFITVASAIAAFGTVAITLTKLQSSSKIFGAVGPLSHSIGSILGTIGFIGTSVTGVLGTVGIITTACLLGKGLVTKAATTVVTAAKSVVSYVASKAAGYVGRGIGFICNLF